QHEDVLVKLTTGAFHGIQVKTQEQGGAPWKTSDEPMKNAVDRFAGLESTFSDHFIRYTIASNHPFHKAATGASFYHLISEAKANPTSNVLKRYVNGIANRVRIDAAIVAAMVRKLRIDDSL